MYSESAVDRVRLLFPFFLQSLPQPFPHRVATVRIKPDELVLASVEGFGAAFRSLGVNERQANGDDFERLTGVTGHVTESNRLVRWKCAARAAPEERRQFDDLVQDRDVVSLFDVFPSDACCHGRLVVGFSCGFHGFISLDESKFCVCKDSSADARLLGARVRNYEEMKLHTHGYSHEQCEKRLTK